MAGEKDKYGVQLNVQIKPGLKRELELYSVKSGLKIKEVVERAITEYMHGN
jgi:hypothetical protein